MCNFLPSIIVFMVVITKLKFVKCDSDLILAENFFVNLYSDPFLENGKFSEFFKEYVDDKVELFLTLMKEKGGTKHTIQRRSIKDPDEKQDKDRYVLEGFKFLNELENKSYIDAVLCDDGEISYIVTLEETQHKDVKLGLYMYNKKASFQQIFEAPTVFAQEVYAIANNDGVFVAVIENLKIHIYQINEKTKRKIQTLDINFVSDVYLWNNKYGLFMAVARNETHLGTSYIYHWLGGHFDLVDKLESFGASSIKAFSIGSSEFIAVANSEDEYGQKEIFSAIFKYNVDTEKYEIHQRIATNGAKDLALSSFLQNGIKEHFLIVLNTNKEVGWFQTCIIYKFIDNYFVPYDGLNLDHPEKIVIISTPNQELLLGVLSGTNGFKIYSYDDWNFNEVGFTFERKSMFNISSIKSSKLANMNVLLIQTEKEVNILEVIFTKDVLKSDESNIMNWCQDNLKQLQPKRNEEQEKNSKVATLGEVDTQNEVERARSANDHETIDDIDLSKIESIESMEIELIKEFKTLKEIDKEISNSLLSTSDEFLMNNTISFDELIINGVITLKQLHASDINNIPINSVLKEKIDLTSIDQLDRLQFEEVSFNNFPTLLNGRHIDSLLNYDNIMNLEKLVVKGDVMVRNNTVVAGYLNGGNIFESSIFIDGINQTFDVACQTKTLTAHNVTVIGSINSKTCSDKDFIEVQKLENLHVKNLNISDYINNVDLGVINKSALKLIGDQDLIEPITFDTLFTNEINIDGLSSTPFNSFVNIFNGTYNFENPIIFNDIEINELNVANNINNIKVNDGVLDVLRKDIMTLQEIVGDKVFTNISLPLIHSGKNNSKTHPIFIEEEITITTDNITLEDIFVKNVLNATNIKSQKSLFGLADIGKEAIKLEDEKINTSLIFTNIAVDNLNTSHINGIPLKEYIRNDDSSQVIDGIKTFNTDININGHTKILHVNNVPLQEFEEKTLKVFGEQILIGNYYISTLTADSVSSNNTKLGNNSWEDISKKVSEINATINIDSLKIKNSHIRNLKVTKINNVNISDILQDIVKNETELYGNITMEKIYVKRIFSKSEFNMDDVPYLIKSFATSFEIENNLEIHKLNITNIDVEGYINDFEAAKFHKDWMEGNVNLEFDDEYTFHNVTILGKSIIKKNSVNNLSLDDLFEKTVKSNENHHFANINFAEMIIALHSIILHGNIIGLDLDSIVAFGNNEQTISGFKTFEKLVLVNGLLELKHKEENIHNICTMLSKVNLYNLVIDGSATFTKGLQVEAVNGIPMSNLINNIWLKNREANLTGYFKFHNINFQSDVHVEGLINEIELENLVSNYFSKSKNQTIFSNLDFTEGINFLNGLKADEMLLHNAISGVKLTDIISNALLDGYTQIFDDTLYVDGIAVEDLNGEYLLNDMDLQRQVMRYDIKNIILGEIKISNLTINNLIASDELVIQNVNILRWLEQAVSKNGGSLEHCNFYNDVRFSKELGVVGYLNGKKFNNQTVLLKSVLQEITGNIFFNPDVSIMYFQNLKLRSLNGIELNMFIKQLVSSNQDVTIKSPINIKSPISVDNLEIKQLYDGINVTNLLNNLTSFNFNNFYENYTQLLNVSNLVRSSLSGYSRYLSHYELIQTLSNVTYADIFNNYLMAISRNNNRHFYHLYMWDISEKRFSSRNYEVMPQFQNIIFIGKIDVGTESYMYIEDMRSAGYIAKFSQEQSFELVEKMLIANTTHSLHNFRITERNLYCVVFISNHNSQVYCKSNEEKKFFVMQTLVKPINKASSLIMNGETFLITSTQSDNYVTIWQYDQRQERFAEIQHIYVPSPCSITAISFKTSHYLAIASSNIEDAIYSGSVQIKWFNPKLQIFISYQSINIDSPKQVEFAILPSNELVLYVLTKSVSESFFVYEYEGVFGFNLKANFNVNANHMKFINLNEEHLILASDSQKLKIIRGLFKSQTYG